MNDNDLVKRLQDILDSQVENGAERGCQLAVFRDGVLIADLAAGWTDPARTKKVTPDSLFPVFSCGKGLLATAFHMLRDRGLVDYGQRVAELWPEFAQNGKKKISVEHVLSHQAALSSLPEGVTLEDEANWDLMRRRMEEATPAWTPGTKTAYHAHTLAWLVGGVAEHALGGDFPTFIRDELFTPLGIENDFFFGLPPEEESRSVPIDGSRFEKKDDFRLRINDNAPVRRAFIPSFNGIGSARAMARHYAALTGTATGFRPLKKETIDEATALRRGTDDPVHRDTWAKFGLGYALCGPPGDLGSMFGHGGAAGSEGFACRKTGLAVGFTKNQLNATHPVHPTRDLISATLGIRARHW